jgi:hypothetical protein
MKLPKLSASVNNKLSVLEVSSVALSSRAVYPSGNDLPREVWWCVTCDSGPDRGKRISQLALDGSLACLKVCGGDQCHASAGRCPDNRF